MTGVTTRNDSSDDAVCVGAGAAVAVGADAAGSVAGAACGKSFMLFIGNWLTAAFLRRQLVQRGRVNRSAG